MIHQGICSSPSRAYNIISHCFIIIIICTYALFIQQNQSIPLYRNSVSQSLPTPLHRRLQSLPNRTEPNPTEPRRNNVVRRPTMRCDAMLCAPHNMVFGATYLPHCFKTNIIFVISSERNIEFPLFHSISFHFISFHSNSTSSSSCNSLW